MRPGVLIGITFAVVLAWYLMTVGPTLRLGPLRAFLNAPVGWAAANPLVAAIGALVIVVVVIFGAGGRRLK